MDRLQAMEVFVAVVEAGSFTAAAERFGITAVMVGKHVRALEEHLGSSLLTRTTRRQSLTEAGRRYYESCRTLLHDIAEAEAGVEALQNAPRGLLRISAPVTFGTQRLGPAIGEYLTQNPDVSVELVLDDRVVDIVQEGFDAAIRIGAMEDSTLVARPLRPYRMVICGTPAYLQKHGTPKRPADLAKHECLSFSRGGRLSGWRLKEADTGPLAWRFRCNNGQALRMAALSGLGLVVQPEALLQADIDAGLLKPVLDEFLPPPRPVHLIYMRDRQATPKLKRFVAFVLERFA